MKLAISVTQLADPLIFYPGIILKPTLISNQQLQQRNQIGKELLNNLKRYEYQVVDNLDHLDLDYSSYQSLDPGLMVH